MAVAFLTPTLRDECVSCSNYMKLYNRQYKKYFKIKLYLTFGRLEVEEVNESNFHPSNINEIYNAIGDKDDISFTVSEEKNIEKNSIKLVKHHLRKVEKELTILRKQQDAFSKVLNRITPVNE